MSDEKWPPEGTLVRFRRREDGVRMVGHLVQIRGDWFVRAKLLSYYVPVQRHEIEVIDE